MDCDSDHEQLNEIIQLLRKHVNVVDMDPPDNSCLPEEGMPQYKNIYIYIFILDSWFLCFVKEYILSQYIE